MLSTSLLLAASMIVGQAEETSPLPEAIARMYEYQMGTWQISGRVGDQPAKGRWTCRWAQGKHCYLITASAGSLTEESVTVRMAAIGGQDSANKQTIEKILWSDDRHYTIRYDVSSPIFDVGVFEGEIVGIVDGNEFKAPVKVERKSPDEFVYISKSADGDEVEVVFRKVDRSKRKRAKGKS